VSLEAPDEIPVTVSGSPPAMFMMCEQTGIKLDMFSSKMQKPKFMIV
jgi:hypothetical protein